MSVSHDHDLITICLPIFIYFTIHLQVGYKILSYVEIETIIFSQRYLLVHSMILLQSEGAVTTIYKFNHVIVLWQYRTLILNK